jgi:hypothetical protein
LLLALHQERLVLKQLLQLLQQAVHLMASGPAPKVIMQAPTIRGIHFMAGLPVVRLLQQVRSERLAFPDWLAMVVLHLRLVMEPLVVSHAVVVELLKLVLNLELELMDMSMWRVRYDRSDY